MLVAPEPDFTKCRLVQLADGTWSGVKEHVKLGVRALLANPYFGLLDEMGAMKSAQTIIAAQFLFEQGVIDQVLVVAPNSVRDVWFDEELGELQKHLFTPSIIQLYHSRTREWYFQPEKKPHLFWIITNYEFIRAEPRLAELLPLVGPKTLLVLDESSAVKSYGAKQTQACFKLRKQCGRIVILNGTPIANNPMDMFSQGNLMHPDILDCRGITHFRARYAIMGGYVVRTAWGSHPTQIVGYQHLDDLQRRFAPYVLRRLKRDCLDLPPVLPAVTLTATLTPAEWKIYKEMRDDLVAWLSDATVSVAAQTITKVLRLSQITSGFIGGLEPEILEDLNDGRPDWLPALGNPNGGYRHPLDPADTTREIGRAKLDVFYEWLDEQFEADHNLKLLIWCRWIPELQRLLKELAERYPKAELGCIAGKALLGSTKNQERQTALRLLDPRTAPAGPVLVGGTYGTGALGLNLTACHTMVKMSHDYSYWKAIQTDARIDRPGQTQPVSQFDIVAVGPQGQKTIDHVIVKALRSKEEVADYTTSAWIHALTES